MRNLIVKLHAPSLPARLWFSSVLAAIAYVLFIYGFIDTEQQLAWTILGTAICGFSPKIPTVVEQKKAEPK